MNVLVVTGSPRKGGNTEIMAEAFAESAKAAGHQVTVRKLSTLKVNPCLGCKYCFTHDGVCVQNDDMNSILANLQQADLLVLASPIYWFDVLRKQAMLAILAILFFCLYVSEYKLYITILFPNQK
ncbi:flavodoxin family protein [Faecalispora anaeroviscerum]|uniref:flavodoxin family protein n=1 Tax=Faecalispora anaeroviscerum TaxID=2991836 RepID=UPI0024BB2B78|nr:flavodoxin family protein [Faecalispora anaeroviscerum]